MTSLTQRKSSSTACDACVDGIEAPFPFSMAYQPIVDLHRGAIYAFEALVRGPDGQSAASVLDQVTPLNRYAFDQSCRVKAIELAASLGITARDAKLSINFIPGAMYRPEACVRATLGAAQRCGIRTDHIVLELTENEEIVEPELLGQIFEVYRKHDLKIAIDDFGAGFSGLGLLVRFQPDTLKIDMALIRGLDQNARQRIIVGATVRMAAELGIDVVAEGVETASEVEALRSLGVNLIQGFFFSRPGFETLPIVAF